MSDHERQEKESQPESLRVQKREDVMQAMHEQKREEVRRASDTVLEEVLSSLTALHTKQDAIATQQSALATKVGPLIEILEYAKIVRTIVAWTLGTFAALGGAIIAVYEFLWQWKDHQKAP